MGRMFRIAAVAVFVLFSAVSSGFTADVAKIGLVDFQKVLTTSSAGKQSKAEINKKGAEMEDQLKAAGNEIEELKNQIERESLVMSAEKSEEKQRELRIKINDFKTMKNNYMKQFQEMERRLVNKIKGETLEIAKTIGKDEGFLLILEKNEAGVLYSPDAIDITDRLIKEYNKSSAKE